MLPLPFSGLNQLLRKYPAGGAKGCAGDGVGCPWDPLNARAWMEHNAAIGLVPFGYELGNEPGCFLPNIELPGRDAAPDYAALKRLIAEVHGGRAATATAAAAAAAAVPMLIGPDVGGCRHANGSGSGHDGTLDDIACSEALVGGNAGLDLDPEVVLSERTSGAAEQRAGPSAFEDAGHRPAQPDVGNNPVSTSGLNPKQYAAHARTATSSRRTRVPGMNSPTAVL